MGGATSSNGSIAPHRVGFLLFGPSPLVTRLLRPRRTSVGPFGERIGEANRQLREAFKAHGLVKAGPNRIDYNFDRDPHTPPGKQATITLAAQWPIAEHPGDSDLDDCEVVQDQGDRYVAKEHHGSLAGGHSHLLQGASVKRHAGLFRDVVELADFRFREQ